MNQSRDCSTRTDGRGRARTTPGRRTPPTCTTWEHGIAGPLSGSNPTVTGIIALMLEMNPRLDAPTIKRILQQTARSDSFTGPTPNPNWGYGKIGALAALQQVKLEMAGP
jgi:hypothetical protein